MAKVVMKSKFRVSGLIWEIVFLVITEVVHVIIFGGLSLILAIIPGIGWAIGGILGIIGAISSFCTLVGFAVRIIRYVCSGVKLTEAGLIGRTEKGKRFSLEFHQIERINIHDGMLIYASCPTRNGTLKKKVYKIENIANAKDMYDSFCVYAKNSTGVAESAFELHEEFASEHINLD